MNTKTLIAAITLFVLSNACEESKLYSDTGAALTDDSTTQNDNISETYNANGTISGDVAVQLYETGEDGERDPISWEDATGGVYIFGGIFTSAYYVSEDGAEHFVGEHVVENPDITPNPYQISVGTNNGEEVYVYSVLDYWQDRIIGSSEPKGVYPYGLPLVDGSEQTGIDIEILAPIYSGGGGCGGDGGGDGTGVPNYVELSGDVFITTSFAGGNAAVMLNAIDGTGPYNSVWLEPEAAGGGAIGSYGFISCANRGQMKLVGAWDSNANNMIEPTDRWGAYSPTPDVDGNPVDILSDDLLGHDIQIPLGDGPGLNMVPFVRLSGVLSTEAGTFDDLPSGTTIYVAAMKYRPSGEFSIAELESSYDLVSFEWPEITGQTSIPYSLTVPANTITYLWAFVDMDANGVINETGEPIASGGDSNGKLPTGTTATASNDLSLRTASE